MGTVAKKSLGLKKLLPIVLSAFLLAGCSDIEEQSKAYKILSYEENYCEKINTELDDIETLRRKIEMLEKDIIVQNRDWGIRQYGGKYFAVQFNRNSEAKNAIIDSIESAVGAGLVDIIDQLSVEPDENISKEKLVGEYGIICSKLGEDIRIKVIKNNIQLTENNTQKLYKKINTPHFMLADFKAGENYNVIKIATPLAIDYEARNYDDLKEMASYYQIFRETDGKIVKIRWVIHTFNTEEKQALEDSDLEIKHLIPLQNIIDHIETQETPIMPIVLDIKKVYEKDQIKASGQINTLNYQIRKYKAQERYLGDLIEVVLTVNE